MKPKITEISTKLNEILSCFDSEQKDKLLFDFEDQERYVWYYTPHPQNGLLVFDMKPFQRKLVYELLELSYSKEGYETAKSIINLENILGDYEAKHSNMNDGGAGHWVRSTERYWLAVFGKPNMKNKPWGYRFGGHHIGLTVNFINDSFTMHPLFFGSNPAKVLEGPNKGFRALAKEEDLARNLISEFSSDKKSLAILSEIAHPDILTENFRKFAPEDFNKGIKFDQFNDSERKKLINLIEIYVNRYNKNISDSYMKKIKSNGFENTYFSWAGSIDVGEGHYYTIKHDSFLIEYDNTQNNANHIHSVLRDFNGDYGQDILAEHYKSSHT